MDEPERHRLVDQLLAAHFPPYQVRNATHTHVVLLHRFLLTMALGCRARRGHMASVKNWWEN
eukprot:2336356-Pyramimonas_sp.AAC.1